MSHKSIGPLRILAAVTVLYVFLAMAWWTVLLYKKNEENYQLKTELAASQKEGTTNMQKADFHARHIRQRSMIIGESLFILMSIFIGVWLVWRGMRQEIRTIQQQRNFLYTVSHELKSPIASIRLVLETLIKHELPPVRKKEVMQSALRETERLTTTIENLLLSARLEQRYVPQFTSMNLNLFTQQLLNRFQQTYPERRVINPHQNDAFAKSFEFDWQGLEIALFNLLENAHKYSPQDAPIELSLSLNESMSRLVCIVKDNGIGIPNSERTSVFKMFYRIGDENTRTSKGTGLGLYIVSMIVGHHKGQISISDNVPSGTVIQLTIPIHEQTHSDR